MVAACGIVPVAAKVPVFPVGIHRHYRGTTTVPTYMSARTGILKEFRRGTRGRKKKNLKNKKNSADVDATAVPKIKTQTQSKSSPQTTTTTLVRSRHRTTNNATTVERTNARKTYTRGPEKITRGTLTPRNTKRVQQDSSIRKKMKVPGTAVEGTPEVTTVPPTRAQEGTLPACATKEPPRNRYNYFFSSISFP